MSALLLRRVSVEVLGGDRSKARRRPALLFVVEGIFAAINRRSKLLRPPPRARGAPSGPRAHRKPPFASVDSIVDNEALRATLCDSQAEAGDEAGIGDSVSAPGGGSNALTRFFLIGAIGVHEVVANHVADDHVTIFNAAHVEIIDVDVELDQRAELAPSLPVSPMV